MSTELQTPRGRAFFWLGMVVFPMFWVWWLNARQFTTRQIRGARLWTVIYVLAVAVAWWESPAFRSWLTGLPWNYSHITFQVGLALWIWLFFRLFNLPNILIGYFIGGEIILGLRSWIGQLIHPLLPFFHAPPDSLAALLFMLIPASAHLSVVPIRRYREGLIRLPWCSMNQSLVTEEHAPVNLQEALQIADRYWERAVENFQVREETLFATTFGFGWKNKFMEICINSSTEISCTLETLEAWPRKGPREQTEQLHDRDAMRQRIQELFTCSPEELRRCFKQQACA